MLLVLLFFIIIISIIIIILPWTPRFLGPRLLAHALWLLSSTPLVSRVTHTGVTPDLLLCPTSPPQVYSNLACPKRNSSSPSLTGFHPGFLSWLMAPPCNCPSLPPLSPVPSLPAGSGGSPSHTYPRQVPPVLPHSSGACHLSAGSPHWPPHSQSPVLLPPQSVLHWASRAVFPKCDFLLFAIIPLPKAALPQQEREC